MARVRSVIDSVFQGTVAIDSREQRWFTFGGLTADATDGGGPFNVPIRRVTLKSGDYSLLGFEEKVAVERKSTADLFGTIGQGRERFERELARLQEMDFAAVVVEAGWGEILDNPPLYTQLPPKTVFRSVLAWQQRYRGVHWVMCDSRRLAEVTTFRILERFWRERQREATEGRPVMAEEVSA